MRHFGSRGSDRNRALKMLQTKLQNLMNIDSFVISRVNVWRSSILFDCFYSMSRTTAIQGFGTPCKRPNTCVGRSSKHLLKPLEYSEFHPCEGHELKMFEKSGFRSSKHLIKPLEYSEFHPCEGHKLKMFAAFN